MSNSEKKSLILSGDYCSVIQSKLFHGVVVPWEVDSYQGDFDNATTRGGIFDLSFHAVLEMRGKDAQDYLQRMTTVQFKTLDTNRVVHGAFLNGRGGVIALALFRRIAADAFQIVVLQDLKQRLIDHVEQFHFSESFTLQDCSQNWTVLGCWSPDNRLSGQLGISSHLGPLQIQAFHQAGPDSVVWRDVRRTSLYWIVIKTSETSVFLKNCLKNGQAILGLHLYEYFRIQSGIPDPGIELSERDLILEGSFEEAVARNKGCYPGQEVVERIFTYGQVNRKLLKVNLDVDLDSDLTLPQLIEHEQKEVGMLVAVEKDPMKCGSAVGLMYVRKEFWNSKDSWSVLPGGRVSLAG